MTPCPHDTIEDRAAPGRLSFYGGLTLPVPDDLSLPTCTECGVWFINRQAAVKLDAVMEPLFQQELARLAEPVFVDGAVRAFAFAWQRATEALSSADHQYRLNEPSLAFRHEAAAGPYLAILMFHPSYLG